MAGLGTSYIAIKFFCGIPIVVDAALPANSVDLVETEGTANRVAISPDLVPLVHSRTTFERLLNMPCRDGDRVVPLRKCIDDFIYRRPVILCRACNGSGRGGQQATDGGEHDDCAACSGEGYVLGHKPIVQRILTETI